MKMGAANLNAFQPDGRANECMAIRYQDRHAFIRPARYGAWAQNWIGLRLFPWP